MSLTQLLCAIMAVILASAFAAPLPDHASLALLEPRVQVVSMLANVPQWSIKSLTRSCNANLTRCIWSMTIDSQTGTPVKCRFAALGKSGTPATQVSVTGATCGRFIVSSGWSGQFGPGNGFTTLAIVDYNLKLISWPAYADRELVNKVTVKPNKSFPVTNLVA